jgi:ComEC/Rec2-related protein
LNPLFFIDMHQITTHIKNTFPDLALWFRFPGLASFVGCIAGIWVFSVLPSEKFDPLTQSSVIIWALILLLISFGILVRNNGLRFILFFLLAGLIFQARMHSFQKITSEINSVSIITTKPVTITGTVISNPAPTRYYSFSFLLQTDSIYNEDTCVKIKKTVTCQGPQAPLYGTVISLQGKITAPQNKNIPFTFNEFDYCFSNDIYARVMFDRFEVLNRHPTGSTAFNSYTRNFILNVINNLTNEEYRSVLRAAFIGESSFLSDNVKLIFRKSGIYHLLSISGLHAAMLMAAAFAFLFLIPVSSNIKRCIAILILWLYQFFIGWQPALVRATIMATVMIAAFLFQKKQYTLQSLGIAGTVVLLYSPQTLFSPGFQLSFAATAGILMLNGRLTTFMPAFGSPFVRTIISHLYSSLSISLCGFLFTAPVLLYHFGSISLFGLVANIAAVTIMSSAMWLFFVSLVLHPLMPFLTLVISQVISLHFDALFYVAALSQHVKFSELKLSVPDTITIIAFTIILIGISTVKKVHLLRFLYISLPIFGIVALFMLSVKYFDKRIQVLQFYDTSSSWTALRWPCGEIWVVNYKTSSLKRGNQEQILNQWMRQYPWTSVKKVFNCESSSGVVSSKQQCNSSPPPDTIEVNDSLSISINDKRVLVKQEFTSTIYQQSSPQQLRVISGSGAFKLDQPLSFNDKNPILLTSFK